MTTKEVFRLAGLMLAAAAGAVLISGPAAAAPAEAATPEAVAAWFATDAPRAAADILADKAVTARGVGDTTRAAATSGYRAGSPHQLHTWGPGVLADGSADATAATDEWVAALFLRGQVIGTIAAATSSGTVRFTYLDDDAAAGAALTSPAPGKVVRDPQLGGLAAVAADGSAKGLSTYTANALGAAKDRSALRAAVRHAHDRSSWDTGDSGAVTTKPAGSAWPGALLLLVVGALVIAFVHRRSHPATP